MSGTSTTIVNPSKGDSSKKKEYSFAFDRSYFWDTPQNIVYKDLGAPMLEKAMQGYNATIFAYGQTGAGKSYSMTGTDESPGIIPAMNKEMFRLIQEAPENMKYFVTVSYLEIYNEHIHDLLNPHGKDMKVRQHPKLGIYVENLAELVVRSWEDIAALLEQGNKVRTVGATEMNKESSRSHSVFTISLQQKDERSNSEGVGAKINLVDLAGSERADSTGATGDQLKEGAAINKSLSALGNVINCLADPKKKSGHIPYRDSKLTRILQESLGGNTQTVMLTAISPADINFEETLNSLNYANRAKNIKNVTKKNESETDAIIRELREEIKRLKAQLDSTLTGKPSEVSGVDQVKKMENMIQDLEMAKKQTWQEKEKLSDMYEHERRTNMANKGILELVMDKLKTQNQELHKRLLELQQQRDELMAEHKEQKKLVDSLKESLQGKLSAYTQGREAGTLDEAEDKTMVAEIHKLKENLKKENDSLKDVRRKLKEVTEKQRAEKEEARTNKQFFQGETEMRKEIEQQEREKLVQENESFLAAERHRMQTELAQEKAELQLRALQGGQHSEQLVRLEMELVEMKAEKFLLATRLNLVEQEKSKLLQHLERSHESYQRDLEVQQLQNFQTFRNYRAVFEDQKLAIEMRFRSVLEESIRDAIFLAGENSKLQEENDRLKQELAAVKNAS
eukprot:m.125031 g.125031  ORF g.125031 m.125031 type:complete len:681 (+) comp23441_c0_seq2:109-2151(+)